MTCLMGPVLSFRGCGEFGNEWHLSALVVTDGDPGQLSLEDASGRSTVGPDLLWSVQGKHVYRYRFQSTLGDTPSSLTYEILGQSYEVALPAVGQAPRMAYGSCNGFSSPKAMKGIDLKNRLWSLMAEKHNTEPYQLLLLGGDQVYADSMWETVPSIRDWNELSFAEGNAAEFTAEMGTELEGFYFDLYTRRWAQPEIAHMLARVPSLLMWDDHDLIDGWGSYLPERQNCPVFAGLWPIAQKVFAVFQQQLAPHEIRQGAIAPDQGFTFGHIIGNTAILALDMRSERTIDRVLSREHWDAVYAWIDGLTELDHLIVMSSIPVVYPGFDTLERFLGAVPGQQDIEDDLRDHWNSRPHKGERIRLIHRLLAFAEKRQIRPTIVSGDVHVAALGLIESSRSEQGSNATVINQLISSGIVHPGPNAAVLFALRHIFDSDDEIDRGIVARMIEFPGTTDKFIGGRNFLSLEPDPEATGARIWANWIVEGEQYPFTKVIHPLRPKAFHLSTGSGTS
ncbi:alkaline phosphatase D family protein [Inquilinus sp. CAU 1745]|uniref:alkaline phosphatase D family protein n=1 Tax=Inquilinus sp. CAU 1745 TaxID=3140369 RepID=UPI00325B7227